MDAFEQIIGQLLEEEKFWVRHSVKINLDKAEKKAIGVSSTPRPEIDIVAYDAVANVLYLLEVKSFLDSKGVIFEDVTVQQSQQTGRYKLLTSSSYRKVLERRILSDWKSNGHLPANVTVGYGLVAGNVFSPKKGPDRDQDLKDYFSKKGWFYWGPTDIKERLAALKGKSYENNAVTIVSKLLMR